MTTQHGFRLSLLIVVVWSWSSIAMAQFGGGQPGSSPTFSPYLNLLRGGSGVGQNYFGLVRPQQEFAQQNQALGQSLQSLQMQGLQGENQQFQGGYGFSQLGATGHPVIFNSFGSSRFSGGYIGIGGGQLGGGFSGGGFSGSQLGGGGFGVGVGQSNFGGVGTTGGGFVGFNSGGVSGHTSQFGGIGNSYHSGR